MGLFGPDWASSNDEKATGAVAKISDAQLLSKVMVRARSSKAVEAAAQKINDPAILLEICGKGSVSTDFAVYERLKSLIPLIQDQALLVGISARIPDLTLVVIEHLSDPNALAHVLKFLTFKTGDSSAHRRATEDAKRCVQRLVDQRLLLNVSLYAQDRIVRLAAAMQLDDVNLIRQFVANTNEDFIKREVCAHEWRTTQAASRKDPCSKCIHCGKWNPEHNWIQTDSACLEQCSACGAKRDAHLFAGWSVVPGSYKSGNGSIHDSGWDTWRETATCGRCGAIGERGPY